MEGVEEAEEGWDDGDELKEEEKEGEGPQA